MKRVSITYAASLICTLLLCSACSKPAPQPDPTGLTAGMSSADTLKILGAPNTIKNAGENKEIYIYRKPAETVVVFFINGRIKNIDHVRGVTF